MKLLTPTRLVSLLMLAGFALFSGTPSTVLAKEIETKPAGQIAYVNIAEVLKGFEQASYRGSVITVRRKQYVDKVSELRNEVAQMNQKMVSATEESEKISLVKQVTKLQRKLEDVDRDAQTELTKLSNSSIIDIYNDVRGVIEEIAREREFDAVHVYPGSKEVTATVAQLILQSPAAYPIYMRPELNITDMVVARLNKKYPVEKKEETKTTDKTGN